VDKIRVAPAAFSGSRGSGGLRTSTSAGAVVDLAIMLAGPAALMAS